MVPASEALTVSLSLMAFWVKLSRPMDLVLEVPLTTPSQLEWVSEAR